MDKWIWCNPKNHLEMDKWHERTSSLDPILTQPVWEGKREKEREKERAFRERSSHFSLDFPAIDLSNPGETRGKIDPHYKSYTWVLVLWSFEKLREVGVFFYLNYSLAKSHFNGWGYLEAWMAVFSVPKIGTE